jgi:Mor family transcriptional regulator
MKTSLSRNSPSRLGAELLEDVADHLADLAVRALGIPEAEARVFAQDAAAHLADLWGGQTVYVPKNQVAIIGKRNAEIYAAFTGDNISDLVTEYNLSRQAIYMIIAAERKRREPKQASLLDTL